MKIDWLPKLPPSSGHERTFTATLVFSSNLFACPTTSQDAKTNVRITIKIMTKLAYLPPTIISDKRSAFVSQVIKEVAEFLEITQQHTTTNHAQPIEKLEWTHTWLKKALKMWSGERRPLCYKYVNIAVPHYITIYLASIGSERSRLFRGRISFDVQDFKWALTHRRHQRQTHKLRRAFLNGRIWFSETIARVPRKPVSSRKRTLTKFAIDSELKECDYV